MQRPALGSVPSPYTSIDSDLTIKVSHTGVTFLGSYNEEKKAYVASGRYLKRYAGSKQVAVDINGRLYPAGLLAQRQEAEKPEKYRSKKKAVGTPPNCLNLSASTSEGNAGQISEENIKKQRKKLYSVNKKEVRQRLLGYVNTQKGKKELYFWTVSFPKGTPDFVCFQVLNIWLTQLRKYRLLKEYLRITERQENGTIHFHIAIPHRMPVQKANAMMRGTLKTFARRGEIPYEAHSPQIAKYNGVDICKHRTTKRVTNFAIKKGARALATYLTKYVTKNDTEFEFLAWHNSRGFSALFTGITFTIEEFVKFGFGHFLNRVRVFKMNFAIFIPWLYGLPPILEQHLYAVNSYIQSITDGRNRQQV